MSEGEKQATPADTVDPEKVRLRQDLAKAEERLAAFTGKVTRAENLAAEAKKTIVKLTAEAVEQKHKNEMDVLKAQESEKRAALARELCAEFIKSQK